MTFKTRVVTLLVSVLGTLAPLAAFAQRPSIAGLQSQLTAQQTQLTAQQAQIASGTIPNVAGYVTMDISTPSRPTLRVAGANLQVVNGLGATGTVNGLGNVIVGYDESMGTLPAVCSLGQYVDQPSCESVGGTWAVVHKTGSHNLVVGPYNRYSRYGGLIAGAQNTVNAVGASVTGGITNTASGNYASVTGGSSNRAVSGEGSISGGSGNTASGVLSSVSGGSGNTASGVSSSVSGGSGNIASGGISSISGGPSRTVSGGNQWVGGSVLLPQ